MKTAMQELIDWIECDNDNNVYGILDKAKELLEKEKEHIIEAINIWCSDDNILTAEQYYNQTYNKID